MISKWVVEAWVEVSKNKEMIKRSSEKYDISVPIDGSKDEAINIRGLQDYRVRLTSEEDDLFELDTDLEEEDPEE